MHKDFATPKIIQLTAVQMNALQYRNEVANLDSIGIEYYPHNAFYGNHFAYNNQGNNQNFSCLSYGMDVSVS